MTIRIPTKLTHTLLSVSLGMALFTASPVSAATTGALSISINGQMKSYPQPPMMIEDRVYIPVRSLFESLGYHVRWEEHGNYIEASKRNQGLTIRLEGDKSITYHDPIIYKTSPDIPIKIIEGRSMIPVRFVSEMLGMEVRWDATRLQVQINSEKNALFEAMMNLDHQKVRTLLEQGTDPNIKRDGHSPLQYAAALHDMLSAERLVERGAVITEDDLMVAAGKNDPELLKFLLTSSKLQKTHAELATDLLPTTVLLYSVESPKFLLKMGADPNTREKNGDSPLSIAIHLRNTETTQDLLNAGADPNTLTREQNPVLIDAVTQGSQDIINLLLTHKADPNASTKEGWTPLMVAAEHGNVPVVRTLLASGANIDAVNKHGGTALAIAEAHGNTDTVGVLTEAGAKGSSTSKLPRAALIRNHARADLTPLEIAAIQGETHRVQQLLTDKHTPIEFHNWSYALSLATEHGNVETTKALLEASYDMPFFDEMLIANLWHYGRPEINEEITRVLIKYDQTNNLNTRHDVIGSIANMSPYHLGLYQVLLEAGYPADQPGLLDHTSLFRMVILGAPEEVRLLLKYGADPNRIVTSDTGKVTIAEIAVHYGRLDTLKLLLDSGKLTQATKNRTLLAAVKRGSIDMATQLLKAGADPYFQAPNGDSPIELAKKSGTGKMIQLFQ